jgi:hypothetical protein
MERDPQNPAAQAGDGVQQQPSTTQQQQQNQNPAQAGAHTVQLDPAVQAAITAAVMAAVTALTSQQKAPETQNNAEQKVRGPMSKYPAPQIFKPPAFKNPSETIRYVQKYLFDLKNYYLYGVGTDVSAVATFSSTSEYTFDFVQTLAHKEEEMRNTQNRNLTIDEVCTAISDRYMPLRNPEYEARSKLLSGGFRMRNNQTVTQFHAELTEAEKAGMAKHTELLAIMFRNALTPELQTRCRVDSNGRDWTDLEALYNYALGEERKLSVLRLHASRANAMRPQGPAAKKQKVSRQTPESGPSGAHQGNRNSRTKGKTWLQDWLDRNPGKDPKTEIMRNIKDKDGNHFTRHQFLTYKDEGRCTNCHKRAGHKWDECPEKPGADKQA